MTKTSQVKKKVTSISQTNAKKNLPIAGCISCSMVAMVNPKLGENRVTMTLLSLMTS